MYYNKSKIDWMLTKCWHVGVICTDEPIYCR